MSKKKFWSFKNLATNKAELQLYGPISEYSWWGDEVTPKQFSEDLKALGDIDELEVRINSGGGDVFAGQTIYALLKSHKATVTVYIDGLAASIASIIAMAADKLVMHSGSMIMIHNPMSSVWGGNADEFRQTADVLDKIRDALVAVYKAKTGKEEEELKTLMDAETWMTAQEALEMGFADEILSDISIAASYQGNFMNVNGLEIDVSNYRNRPNLPAKPSEKPIRNLEPSPMAVQNSKKEEEIIVDIKDLQAKYPELYNQVYNEGIKAERSRIQAIEDVAMAGYEDLVSDAKYTSGISAEQVAMKIVKAEKEQGKTYLADVNDDAADILKVKGDATPQDTLTKEQKEVESAKAIAEAMNKRRGIK